MNAIVAEPNSQGWRGREMSPETREVLRQYCHSDLSDLSAVALFWFMRNNLYFEQDFQHDPRVKILCYEAFVQAPQQYSMELFSWLGLRGARYASRIGSPRSISRWPQPDTAPPIRALCEDIYRRFELEAMTISVDKDSSRSNAFCASKE